MSCTTKVLRVGSACAGCAAFLILWLLVVGCSPASPSASKQKPAADRTSTASNGAKPKTAKSKSKGKPEQGKAEPSPGEQAEQDESKPEPTYDAESESDEARRQRDRIKANNVVALREAVGKRVTVHGFVGRTAKSGSGHQFLNFADTELSAVCLPENSKRFTDGPPFEVYKNRHVELTGTVELYKGKLQIQLTEPSQIKIVEASSEAKTVELKQVGKDAWLSPAGLRYQGRDPDGLTRVEHVRRHIADQPKREGSHGVFDGGAGVAFATIDEAWSMIEKKKIQAEVEGNRSAYLVPMGRRVGYLGGRTGAERRYPPLTRVFLVVETGTKNIITAFPK